ncbi:MAG: mercuric transporter MerT family protein [Wenzhouxiangellaceae bacterium]|nr:mercuric transporter MerT family protein [Wenzhouxiangellaceae bacterium]
MRHDDTAPDPNAEIPESGARAGLLIGGLGAIAASACCVLPFILVTLGLGGAWLARLHALYPYRWLFIGAAAVALLIAWRRLYRPQTDCGDGQICAVPAVRRAYRVLFWTITGLVVVSTVTPYLLGAILN